MELESDPRPGHVPRDWQIPMTMLRRNLACFWLTIFSFAAMCVASARATEAGLDNAPSVGPDVRRAMRRVRTEGIREHVRYLADDKLEGRDTASPGGTLAARYLASQLEQFGVKPAGDRGTYFQQVPFVRTRLDAPASQLVLLTGDQPLIFEGGKDLLPNGPSGSASVGESPVVFAGYGISAPEFHYDDYEKLDVRGKLVVLLTGEPGSNDPAYFDGMKDTPHSSGVSKIALARSRGARGVITVLAGPRASRYPWDLVLKSQETPQFALPASKDVMPAIIVRSETAARLFKDAPKPWNEIEALATDGKVPTFALPYHARLDLKFSEEPAPAPNVLGRLDGSDPALKKQVVVYTAHYDHVGRGTGEGDTIFNGAWDNASGTSEVLEIARGFAGLKRRPRRSVLFLFVTGEEKGLLGSEYYAAHPAVPIADTAADINLDMTDIFGLGKELVAQGAEHSTLMKACEETAREMGLTLGKDPTPELNVFTRSDQFSFAKVGVPCVFMRWSNNYEDLDAATAKARSQEKLKTIYHKVGDEFDPTWNWDGMQRHAQSALLIGLHVANDTPLPSWNEGDPFNKPRKSASPGS